jgi:hypothetical protein
VLKGKLHKVASIQEAKDNSALQQVLKIINAAESAFFSVGCERSFNHGPQGFWAKGYIEFAGEL